MALILILSLFAGCSDTSKTSSPAEPPKDLSLSDSATSKNIKITAEELEISTGDDFFVPSDGNVFVGVKFTFKNN